MAIAVQMFVIAVKIALPIIFAVLVADIAMGFVAELFLKWMYLLSDSLRIMVGLVTDADDSRILWVFTILFSRFFTYLMNNHGDVKMTWMKSWLVDLQLFAEDGATGEKLNKPHPGGEEARRKLYLKVPT